MSELLLNRNSASIWFLMTSLVFRKNFVYELWTRTIGGNQIAGFFKIQYLKEKSSYEVCFLYMNRHSKALRGNKVICSLFCLHPVLHVQASRRFNNTRKAADITLIFYVFLFIIGPTDQCIFFRYLQSS